ncbi:MAG: signal peptide peptidase SppA [Hyphomonadaceae bacterium]|nr:signal peptide peptidase SppA [Hyphomonadaceae bacterium]
MKTFLLSMAGALVAMFLFIFLSIFLLFIFAGIASMGQKEPDTIVLTMDLRQPVSDQAPTSGFAAFSGQQGFTDLLVKIDRATEDDHVKGIFIRGADTSIGSSRAEELRDALIEFRASGKFILAHTQGAMVSSGPSSYRAISVADEIWMQPGTDFVATGIAFETQFLRGLFDKLSITPEIEALYEFKNAPNSYKNETYTEPHRLALAELADSIWTVSLHDIAEDRGLQFDALKTLLESGPIPAELAQAESLVDTLGWPEDARDAAKERAGEKANLISLTDYSAPTPRPGAPMIAVVGGEGPIVTGSASGDPFADTVGFGSDRVARAILDAAEDEKIQAIVFRVDSPGGSPTASDQIWNAIQRARDAGKPVVVSMGSVAASGGYYVSAGADRILASDTTITGSIGIFGGKLAIGEGLQRIGVNIETVRVGGEWTEAFSVDRFTNAQRAQMVDMLERGYDRFTSIVAEGRGLTQEEVHERARGRVWSGEDAIQNGLVDRIGGFLDAIDEAKSLADIDADKQVRLVYFPSRRSGFDALSGSFGVSAEAADTASTLHELASDPDIRILLQELQAAREGGVQVRGPILVEQ